MITRQESPNTTHIECIGSVGIDEIICRIFDKHTPRLHFLRPDENRSLYELLFHRN